MSVLETPRILFKGQVSWDPITTNNYPQFYDESTDEPVFQDEAHRVQAFRAQAIAAVTQAGNWNPHGTHRATFFESAISGVDIGAGATRNDPFVDSAANFRGMLVDLEPYGSFSSQLFFNSMHFGIDGGYRILCPRSSRITARYINFSRNPANAMIAGVASAVWQTSFAKHDGLRVDAFDSHALQNLHKALNDDDVLGLTVRFNVYRTIYYDDLALTNGSPLSRAAGEALIKKLNSGGFQPNPARSMMVGVIGLWRQGEPVHEPGDRALLPIEGSPVGAAHARLHGRTLTLDLSNSIPEVSKDLKKKDLGPLRIVAVNPANGDTVALGTLSYAHYNRHAYEAGSGIVSLGLTSDAAKIATDWDIQLRDTKRQVLLREAPLRAVPLTPNLYLDETTSTTSRNKSARTSATASFQIYHRGVPASRQFPVTMYQLDAGGSTILATLNMQSDTRGVVSFTVNGVTGGVYAFVPSIMSPSIEAVNGNLQFNSTPMTNGIDPQYNTYMYVRTLAADDAIGTLPATWDNVYTRVLANWNAMAPCMDNWLKLNDPVQVKSYATVLKRLTDTANFEDFLYMPVVRDMTVGERTLLLKFLDAPDAEMATAAKETPAADAKAKLSGAMRRP